MATKAASLPCASAAIDAKTILRSSQRFKGKRTFNLKQKPDDRRLSLRASLTPGISLPSLHQLVPVVAPAASSFGVFPPPIDHDLLDFEAANTGTLSDNGLTQTFQNDDDALDVAYNSVAIVDLSHWGRIRVSGEDRIQFLHNQSTTNFECLQEGQGCDTVFVTPTARTIDIAHAWVMRNAITLLVSHVTCKGICDMLERYIFPSDKVEIEDITSNTCFFVLVGPRSNQVMEHLGLSDLVGRPYGSHQHFSVNQMAVTVGVGNVISEGGYSMMMSPETASLIWKTIISQGVVPLDLNAWEKLRVNEDLVCVEHFPPLFFWRFPNKNYSPSKQRYLSSVASLWQKGRPYPGKELTDEFNVLEAGLWNSISLTKGCYKGQETISRLITYDGIKQKLWGLILSGPAELGSPITIDDKKVGKLTSYAVGQKDSEHVGLGYVKRRVASEGDKVIVDDNIVGTLVNVPYLANQTMPSNNPIS